MPSHAAALSSSSSPTPTPKPKASPSLHHYSRLYQCSFTGLLSSQLLYFFFQARSPSESSRSLLLRSLSTFLPLILLEYTCYIIIWRLYLSPISHFPGPRLAATTWLYEMYYDIWKNGQLLFRLRELHEEYGPIIRINPRELHISDSPYFDTLYTHKGRWDKSPLWCAQFGVREAEVVTVTHDLHRMRRGVLAPFFSKQKVMAMEERIREQIEGFCRRVERERREKEEAGEQEEGYRLPIRLAMNCLTLGILVDFCFGKGYGMVELDDWGCDWHRQSAAGFKLVHWSRFLPFWTKIENMVPTWLILWQLKGVTALTGIRNLLKDMQEARVNEEQNSLERETVFAVLKSSSLPNREKSEIRFRNVAGQLITAGSDTSTNTLHGIIWYVLSDKKILDRLRAEIATVQPDPRRPASLRQLEQLPYLTACIAEGLRLGNGVAQASPRVAPDRSIWYRNWEIPVGTPVGMTSPDIHYDKAIFPEPEKFDPERWMDRERKAKLDRFLVPFSKGTRMCLGINLAWAELYMITATIFTRFDLELCDDVNFEDHVKLAHANFFPQTKKDVEEFQVWVK